MANLYYIDDNGQAHYIPVRAGVDSVNGQTGAVEVPVPVKGVSVAGTALTPDADGNVDVPKATAFTPGVGIFAPAYGTQVNGNGQVFTAEANQGEIDTRNQHYKVIVPSNLDYAVRAGLISNSQITDADKPLICETIGAEPALGDFEKIYREVLEFEDYTQIAIELGGYKRQVRVFIDLVANSGQVSDYGLVEFFKDGKSLGNLVEFGGYQNAHTINLDAYICYNAGELPTFTTWSDSGGRGPLTLRNGMISSHAVWQGLNPYQEIDKLVLKSYKGKVRVGVYAR